ncbi:serine hydrolase [Amycolatopsis sp. NPDC059657]|uniref:serine hydrolase n=1 Tax=Amycolatopsis sp. NPDC059657 TaxID=3346899 RepID=UPI003672F4B3
MSKRTAMLLSGLCLGAIVAMLAFIYSTRGPVQASVAMPLETTAAAITPSEDEPEPTPEPEPSPTPTPTPSSKTSTPKLASQVPGGQLAAMVYDRQENKALLAEHADTVFTTASLVKLLIAFDALDKGTSSNSTVTQMLSRSDDNIASSLWVMNGGQSIVTRWAAKLGLARTKPPADPGHWGSTRTTASDMVKVYRYLMDNASDSIRSVVLTALRKATKTGADGFDQYFGIPNGIDKPWAVKQGWSCCDPTRNLHTTGLVGEEDRYIVVILTSRPSSVSWAAGSRQVTTASHMLESLLN